jgi:hypothetical protein
VAAGRAPLAPTADDVTDTVSFPDAALLDGLTALAGAGSRLEVAESLCAVLLGLDGVRAAALTQRDGRDARVVGSAGYGCDVMAAGARLPLDSGLPVAEAIQTGRLVRQGTGPGWCAVPFGPRTTGSGALLLSLSTAPPADPADLARLQRLADAAGLALARAQRAERVAADLATVVAGLSPPGALDTPMLAIRQTARGGILGGDVALGLADGAGGRWLVVADVCGSGLPAATGAAAVRTAVHGLAPAASGPAHLLELLDAALRPESPEGGFVTAVAVHIAGGVLRAASAGHPAPVLVTGPALQPLPIEPGPPLALETADGRAQPAELRSAVPAGAMVVLYSDGLTDRRGGHGAELDVADLLAGAGAAGSPGELADALVAAADAAGRVEDDTTVLVSRV